MTGETGLRVRQGLLLALILAGLVLLASLRTTVHAQYPPPNPNQGPAVNPYTGRSANDGAAYNPLTRSAGQSSAGYNPYTGANPGSTPPGSALTGSPPPEFNPLTGRYDQRSQKRYPPGSYQRQVPITGLIGPGLSRFDDTMISLLEKRGIPGGALAVVKDGRLVAARGYGWGNLESRAPVTANATFAIASLSKTLTAVGILKLVDDGKLKLEDRVYRVLSNLKPPSGYGVDPRMDNITIRDLLNHSGGWNRNISGEPWSFSWRVSRRLFVPLPVTTDQLGQFMLSERLDFDPGTEQHYSNYGYILLGQVIEKVTGVSQAEYVVTKVLNPTGISHTRLPGANRGYESDEVRMYSPGTYQLISSDFVGPLGDAAAGWRSTAVDLARFLVALDGSRGKAFLSPATWNKMLADPPPPLKVLPGRAHAGLGWDAVITKDGGTGYFKDGRLPGCRTFMGKTPAGVNFVLLFNSGDRLSFAEVQSELHPRHNVEQSIKETTKWPEVDYFDSFK